MAKNETIFERGFKTKAERLGESYRTQMGLHVCSPLSARRLAEHLNYPVFSVTEIVENGGDLKLILGAGYSLFSFSGVNFVNIDGDRVIMYNDSHSTGRQESTIMHEIAHIELKHSVSNEYADIPIPHGMRYHNELQEEEASFLGGCLQLSKPCLQWASKRNMSIQEIADHFFATTDMVEYRMNISGVKKQQYYMRRKTS